MWRYLWMLIFTNARMLYDFPRFACLLRISAGLNRLLLSSFWQDFWKEFFFHLFLIIYKSGCGLFLFIKLCYTQCFHHLKVTLISFIRFHFCRFIYLFCILLIDILATRVPLNRILVFPGDKPLDNRDILFSFLHPEVSFPFLLPRKATCGDMSYSTKEPFSVYSLNKTLLFLVEEFWYIYKC